MAGKAIWIFKDDRQLEFERITSPSTLKLSWSLAQMSLIRSHVKRCMSRKCAKMTFFDHPGIWPK